MAQGVPLVADSYQLAKMLPVLRNAKVHHVHKSPAVNPITNKSHPVQVFTTNFLMIPCNIVLSSVPRLLHVISTLVIS